jgi:DNA-binding response OmpR family regulator
MGKSVLVAEDDPGVRGLVTKALKAKGYAVQEAKDGLHASELLGRLDPPPDLLICDVMMPTVDGFSLAKLIRNQTALKSMAIIFLTAKTSPTDLVQGINLGARHYIQKPFSVKDLLDKVEKVLR